MKKSWASAVVDAFYRSYISAATHTDGSDVVDVAAKGSTAKVDGVR